jgi:hypothetical protein
MKTYGGEEVQLHHYHRHWLEVNRQLYIPAALSREIAQVPIGREAGWAPEPVWML